MGMEAMTHADGGKVKRFVFADNDNNDATYVLASDYDREVARVREQLARMTDIANNPNELNSGDLDFIAQVQNELAMLEFQRQPNTPTEDGHEL